LVFYLQLKYNYWVTGC